MGVRTGKEPARSGRISAYMTKPYSVGGTPSDLSSQQPRARLHEGVSSNSQIETIFGIGEEVMLGAPHVWSVPHGVVSDVCHHASDVGA
jgi:hypothetical protein